MDDIPFEKVSIEEARAVLNKEKSPARRTLFTRDWRPGRRTPGVENQELAKRTFRWLARFPKETRPNVLALQYPRIANRLAELWKQPVQCERYLDELILDMRGDRRGFSREVAAEIAALKVYFVTHAVTIHYGVWGNRIGIDK